MGDPWGYAAGFAGPSSDRYKRTVDATTEPVTLAEVKAQCSILDSSWDTYLTGLITKARSTIERRIGRQFLPATWVLSLDAFPAEVQIEVTPVSAVTSIAYVDYAGNTQTLPEAQYQVDISGGRSPARIRPVWGLVWPITRAGTFNAVAITFTAGYANAASVPPEAAQAILMLAAEWFKHREPTSEGVVNQVPLSIDWALEADNPGIYT